MPVLVSTVVAAGVLVFELLGIVLDSPGRAVVGDDTGRFVEIQMASILEHQINEIVAHTAPWRVLWPCQNTRPAPRQGRDSAALETDAGTSAPDTCDESPQPGSHSGHLPVPVAHATAPEHATTDNPAPAQARGQQHDDGPPLPTPAPMRQADTPKHASPEPRPSTSTTPLGVLT